MSKAESDVARVQKSIDNVEAEIKVVNIKLEAIEEELKNEGIDVEKKVTYINK